MKIINLNYDIFEKIIKLNNFNKNIILNNTNKNFHNILLLSKYFDYQKKNYASNLIKLVWVNHKILSDNGIICLPTINTKDPDLGYSMNNWLFVYYKNQNILQHDSAKNYISNYWKNNVIIEIHPFTILQNPDIKKYAIEKGLSYNTMVLYRQDIDFTYNYKKIISRILHINTREAFEPKKVLKKNNFSTIKTNGKKECCLLS